MNEWYHSNHEVSNSMIEGLFNCMNGETGRTKVGFNLTLRWKKAQT